MRTFWVVLRDMKDAPPGWVNTIKVAHDSEDAARAVAAKMAAENGGTFYVLRSVAAVRPATPPVEWLEEASDVS